MKDLSHGVRRCDLHFRKNRSGCYVKNKPLGVKDKGGNWKPVIWTRGDGGCVPGSVCVYEGEAGGVEAQVRTIERWLEISDPWKESQPGVVINRM